MSKHLLPSPEQQARIAKAMWDRVEDDIKEGGDRAAAAAMGIVRSVLLPPPPSKVTQQVVVGSVDGGRLQTLDKVNKRLLTDRGADTADTTDATFTPLPRVQSSE